MGGASLKGMPRAILFNCLPGQPIALPQYRRKLYFSAESTSEHVVQVMVEISLGASGAACLYGILRRAKNRPPQDDSFAERAVSLMGHRCVFGVSFVDVILCFVQREDIRGRL